MDSLTEFYCLIDDFCRAFEPAWERHLLATGAKRRQRPSLLSLAELMTLAILFHQLRFRQFKGLYLGYVCRRLCAEFPKLPSYQRCVGLLPRCAAPLAALFDSLKGQCDGIAIAYATALAVCDNQRIPRHEVFKGRAERGKTSMGWFYGFKLHAIINSKGELLRLKLTPGNVDDRKPMPELCQGLQLITTLKKNRKPVPSADFEKAILRRRSLIETVFDELKNLCQIERTRHRSHFNFVVNLMTGITAYCLSNNQAHVVFDQV